MSESFPMVPLSDLIQRRKDEVAVQELEDYIRLTIHMNGKGISVRDKVPGSNIGTKLQFVVHAGQLVLSKIDARNGAFGIVPVEGEGAIITGNFWAFDVNSNLLDIKFFDYLTKTPRFIDFCVRASDGTTNRHYLQEPKFLAQKVILPSIEEQHRIVVRIEELAEKIEEARGLRREAAAEVEALTKQAYELAWTEAEKKSSSLNLLEQLADVIDPQPDHRTPAEVADGMPYVSITNISLDGHIDVYRARKVSPKAIEHQEASFILKTGDIVLGKIGTIGAARPILVKERFALSANVVLVQPFRDKILESFLLVLLRSAQAEKQFESGTRVSAQGAFGIKKMRKLLIPLPSISKQQQILTYFSAIKTRVDELKQKQSEISAELDALLPSVLDKAFKGEL